MLLKCQTDRFGKTVQSQIRLKEQSPGGEWRLLVNLVPMLEQKNDEKGYFFFKLGSAQRCHHLGSEKWHFSGKRVGFLKSDKLGVKIQTGNHDQLLLT